MGSMRHLRPARRQLTSPILAARRAGGARARRRRSGRQPRRQPTAAVAAPPTGTCPPKNLAPSAPPLPPEEPGTLRAAPTKNLAPFRTAATRRPVARSPASLAKDLAPPRRPPRRQDLAPTQPPPKDLAPGLTLPTKDLAPGLKLRVVGDSVVELRAERGGVVARITVATPPALRRGAPVLRAREVDGHQIAELRIPVRGRPGEEVWIGDLTHVPARVIWSGIAGPRGADEETAVWVEVTADRIFEFQTAAQVSRCDGEAVRLFTRAWDFGSGKFRPILSSLPPPAPPEQKLIARRDDPAMPRTRPMGGFRFTSASTTAAAGSDAGALSAPSALDDGDPRTVWAEGLGGDGRGEFLTARASAGHYRVRGLRIVPGDASTATAFKSRNRLKALAVALGPDPARRFDVEFPEDPAVAAGGQAVPYWIAFPAPVDAACLTLVIREVYRGTRARAKRGRWHHRHLRRAGLHGAGRCLRRAASGLGHGHGEGLPLAGPLARRAG